MPVVILHMGAFKSGTSFIQHVLKHNRDELAAHGVLVPTDANGSALRLFRAFWQGREGPSPGTTRLVRQSRDWSGHHVIVSAERLSLLQPAAVSRLVEAFRPHPVRVVMTIRDLGRTVPSQWQSFARGATGARSTYRQYIDAVVAGDDGNRPVARMFWERHSWPDVLHPWVDAVGAQAVSVVTVPNGSAPGDLWSRFVAASGVDLAPAVMPPPSNTSLGAASAEIVRRTSLAFQRIPAQSPSVSVGRDHLLRVLARQHMTQRSTLEPRLAFPPEHTEWVSGVTDILLERLQSLGTELEGSWDDMTCHVPASLPTGSTLDPDLLPSAELAAAAEFALARTLRRQAPPVAPDDASIDRAVLKLAEVLTRRAERKKSPLPGEDSNPY